MSEFTQQDRDRITRVEDKVDQLLVTTGRNPSYAQMWAAIVSTAGLAFAAARLLG